jgi:hypothetical protein
MQAHFAAEGRVSTFLLPEVPSKGQTPGKRDLSPTWITSEWPVIRSANPTCLRQAGATFRSGQRHSLKVPLQFHRVLIAEHCVLFSERLKTARFRVRLVLTSQTSKSRDASLQWQS